MAPRFIVPPGASPGQYSLKPDSSNVWLMRIKENTHGKIALAGGGRLTVRSNNPTVLPNDFSVVTKGDMQVFELYGRMSGNTMLEARGSTGAVEAYIQVQVEALPATGRTKVWIRLDPPQIALNSPGVVPFRMKYSPVIPWDWSADRIMDAVPEGVRHVVFNCHGIPTGKKASFPVPHLSIGTAIHPGNVSVFSKLFSIWTLRVIWMSACNLADGSQGDAMCSRIARESGCYVVSEFLEVPDRAARANHIEDYVNSKPKYWSPEGGLLKRGDFFAMGRELGFEHL